MPDVAAGGGAEGEAVGLPPRPGEDSGLHRFRPKRLKRRRKRRNSEHILKHDSREQQRLNFDYRVLVLKELSCTQKHPTQTA